jgi:hypothetical protein
MAPPVFQAGGSARPISADSATTAFSSEATDLAFEKRQSLCPIFSQTWNASASVFGPTITKSGFGARRSRRATARTRCCLRKTTIAQPPRTIVWFEVESSGQDSIEQLRRRLLVPWLRTTMMRSHHDTSDTKSTTRDIPTIPMRVRVAGQPL